MEVEIGVEQPTFTPPSTITTADPSLTEGTSVVDDTGTTGVSVRTKRIFRTANRRDVEDLGLSIHHAVPRRVREGPSPAIRS